MSAHLERIAAMLRDGKNQKEISVALSLSRERVRQLIVRHHAVLPPPFRCPNCQKPQFVKNPVCETCRQGEDRTCSACGVRYKRTQHRGNVCYLCTSALAAERRRAKFAKSLTKKCRLCSDLIPKTHNYCKTCLLGSVRCCVACERILPTDEFYSRHISGSKAGAGRDRFLGRCKNCHNQYCKDKWREAQL